MTETNNATVDFEKFRVSKEFDPDKGSLWVHPMNVDGWVLAHDALRGEVTDMMEAIKAIQSRNSGGDGESGDGDGDGGVINRGWQLQYLQDVWKIHYEHMHAHHTAEDNMFVPELRKRVVWPEKLEADHSEIEGLLEDINKTVDNLKEGDTVDGLWKQLDNYNTVVKPHLLEEETTMLPLTRAYFSPEEVGVIIQKIIAAQSKHDMGAFIHYCGGEDSFRNGFMKREGIPFFVWYIHFSSCLNVYTKDFTDKVQAIKDGTEIVPPQPWYAAYVEAFMSLFSPSKEVP